MSGEFGERFTIERYDGFTRDFRYKDAPWLDKFINNTGMYISCFPREYPTKEEEKYFVIYVFMRAQNFIKTLPNNFIYKSLLFVPDKYITNPKETLNNNVNVYMLALSQNIKHLSVEDIIEHSSKFPYICNNTFDKNLFKSYFDYCMPTMKCLDEIKKLISSYKTIGDRDIISVTVKTGFWEYLLEKMGLQVICSNHEDTVINYMPTRRIIDPSDALKQGNDIDTLLLIYPTKVDISHFKGRYIIMATEFRYAHHDLVHELDVNFELLTEFYCVQTNNVNFEMRFYIRKECKKKYQLV